MEDFIMYKIKTYCEKVGMKMKDFSIKTIEDGYLASDGYMSIIFDKNGNISSLPMYQLYGKKTTQFIGKSYGIFVCIAIALIFLIIVFDSVIK